MSCESFGGSCDTADITSLGITVGTFETILDYIYTSDIYLSDINIQDILQVRHDIRDLPKCFFMMPDGAALSLN